MRTFLLHGLNTVAAGKVFDGLLPNGARAGYIDMFRSDAEPGSGGKFSEETVYAPYGWSELMARSRTDAKVIALNAESEYYEMMAYLTHRGSLPENVRVYDFPLGGHGGGGPAPWRDCVQPLSLVLEELVANGPSRRQSPVHSSERGKPAGQAFAVASRPNFRRSTSWALPWGACGFRRSRCPWCATSPRGSKSPNPCRWTKPN